MSGVVRQVDQPPGFAAPGDWVHRERRKGPHKCTHWQVSEAAVAVVLQERVSGLQVSNSLHLFVFEPSVWYSEFMWCEKRIIMSHVRWSTKTSKVYSEAWRPILVLHQVIRR